MNQLTILFALVGIFALAVIVYVQITDRKQKKQPNPGASQEDK